MSMSRLARFKVELQMMRRVTGVNDSRERAGGVAIHTNGLGRHVTLRCSHEPSSGAVAPLLAAMTVCVARADVGWAKKKERRLVRRRSDQAALPRREMAGLHAVTEVGQHVVDRATHEGDGRDRQRRR